MSNEFSTPKLTPADAVKIPGVDGNNDSGYLLSKEVKDYMVGGLEGDVQDYSTLETYTVGQRVKNEGDLYRCKTAVEVPEVFDPTKWDKIDLPSLDERVLENAEDIATNATNIQANTDAITSLSQHTLTSGTYDLDDIKTGGLFFFANTTTLANTPNNAVNGWLIVLSGEDSGHSTKQIWLRKGTVGTTSRDLYIRDYLDSAGWGEWNKIYPI